MAVYEGARRKAALPLGLDGLGGSRHGGDRSARSGGVGQAGAAGHAGTKARSRPKGRLAAAAARRRATAARRPSSVGIALAAIVIVFGAAFLSLSQSVRVAATGYDIVRLVSEQDRLHAIRQDLQSDVRRLNSEPAIRKQALDAGLGQLGAPIVIPAR
jgi:hypothetical protein